MNNKETLVSIAMCTYNGERFIIEQLDSILAQTHKNIELIITDDGSRDNTIQIIEKYIKKDNRIKLYQNKKNLGFVKNFEKSISLCNGEYIALTDQDDIWKVNKLEHFLEEIEDNILIYSDAILIDKSSNKSNKELIRPKNNLVKGSCNKAFLLTNCVSGNTLMFKKELTQYILPIPKEISFHDIWIAFVASTYSSITYTKEAMTYYRRYNEQITRSREKNYKNFFDRLKKKEEIKRNSAEVSKKDLNIFLNLKILKDKPTQNIIKELINHFENYEKKYYNFKLSKTLAQYKDEIFAIRKNTKRDRRVRRTSIGLKLHKKVFFTI